MVLLIIRCFIIVVLFRATFYLKKVVDGYMKDLPKSIAICILLLVGFNVIAFLVPFSRGGWFWYAYAYGNLACILCCLFIPMFDRGEDKVPSGRKRYRPEAPMYELAASLIACVFTMAVTSFAPSFPKWKFIAIDAVIIIAGRVIMALAALDSIETSKEDMEGKDNILQG